MDFYEVLDEVLDLLRRRGRVTHRALKVQFQLDDEQMEALKEELLYAHAASVEIDDRGLIWLGETVSTPEAAPTAAPSGPPPASASAPEPEREPLSYTPPHLAKKILTARSALEGERKHVTILFCDLQNSTPIAEQLGPEPMHALLNRFFEAALSEIHRYEGTINQFLGDGFMALFGAPLAHEDHARRAVLAAIGLQQRLQDANPGDPDGVACRFRIGINSGLVVVASIGDNLRMDYTAVGDATNLAARLQAQAAPGAILVSDATARLVEGDIRLEALTPIEVKGKAEPVATYQVLGALPRRSPMMNRSERMLSPLVGRERELAVLEDILAQVEAGDGKVVGIVGEAGQGKSRVLYEFRQRFAGRQITYLEGRCLSYGGSLPYHPVIDVLRHHCGVTEADSPESITEKIRRKLRNVGMDADASAPYLLHLLGAREGTEAIARLTPEAVRTRTFEVMRQMSLQDSQRQLLIMEIEDLHWIDHTSEDYLASLAESLTGGAILLLATYRPGYQPPWLGKSYATQISLHSLNAQEALNIVHATRQDAALPDDVAQTIVAKAEGNPFFLEELTRAVIERGDFQAEVMAPDTIQGVLSARIDRLPESHKRGLQTAAVLGREFSSRLLREIWDGSGSLDALLLDLQRMEFVFERTGAAEPVYVFKHALTQDVAYASLLTTRRQALHAAAGQALETLYAERLGDVYDRLAYHYARTDDAAQAVKYLTLVAERAAQAYAHDEALTILEEALLHAERLPVERDYYVLDLAIRQAEHLFRIGRRQELLDLLLGYQTRLEQLQNSTLSGKYYITLGRTYAFEGRRQEANDNLQQALQASDLSQDIFTKGVALRSLVAENYFSSQFLQSIDYGEQAISIFEELGSSIELGMSYFSMSVSCYFIGDFERSLRFAFQGEHVAKNLLNRSVQSYCITMQGWIYAARGDWEAGVSCCESALQVSPQAFDTALATGIMGYAILQGGSVKEGIPVLESALEQAILYRSKQVQIWFQAYLGEAYLLDGQFDSARDLAQQASSLSENVQHPWGAALAQRLLGRIGNAQGDTVMAAEHLGKALQSFASMSTRYELARTHLDLASLAHRQNDQDAAATHLSAAYAWFRKLQTPKWAEKTAQLTQAYGATLSEVELDDVTEGSAWPLTTSWNR